MALVLLDRAKETTNVTGTGTATLLGAVTSYQSLAGVGNGNTTYYCIVDQVGANWEVGIGTYTLSGTTLARTTVLKSSNANALVSFTAGTKDVFVTYPAETSVSGGGGGAYPTIQPTLNLDFANTKQLDPRITFVRNSTAAYYDGQTSALAEQNLLVQSQLFSATPWSIYNSTATNNTAIAPDGTTTAASCIEDTTVSNGHGFFQSYTTSANTYVGSAYVKTLTRQYAYIGLFEAAAYSGVIIDLIAGTILSTRGTLVSSSIVSLGSGWYRVNITKIMTATASALGIFLSDSATPTYLAGRPSYTGDGTSGIYIWGAQVEQRSSATAYTPTTTAAITNYIPVLMTAPAGVARFDCDPITGKSLGLLIEESRTNLTTYSSDFSNAVWLKNGATVTNAANVAPDGTLTAQKLVETTAAGLHQLYGNTISGITAIPYTYSVYAKYSGRQWIALQIGGSTYFDLLNGVVGTSTSGSTGTITSVGNGWYRCSTTRTLGVGTVPLEIYLGNSNGGASYTGDGYSGIFIWGAQLEAGSFATSYINTVASTVTRAADSASMTGTNFSSWYNQAQGTYYLEAEVARINANSIYWLYGGVTNIRYIMTGGNSLTIGMYDGISNPFSTIDLNAGATNKLISAYTNTTNSITANGKAPYSASFLIASQATQFTITTNGSALNGHIRKLSYYPVALSSSNLVALTS